MLSRWMIGAMASYLTPEEALKVAGFYRSDIGRRLMGNVVANFDMEQTLSSAVAEKDITEADVRADINSAVSQGISQMDPSDLAEMGRQALANPALLKLQNVNPQIQRLRAQIVEADLLPCRFQGFTSFAAGVAGGDAIEDHSRTPFAILGLTAQD